MNKLGDPREITDEDWATVTKVMDAVIDYEYGIITLDDFRRQTTAAERHITVRCATTQHSCWDSFMRVLDTLIATDSTGQDGFAYATRFGTFTTAEIRANHGRMSKLDDGRLMIEFPVRVAESGPVYSVDQPTNEPAPVAHDDRPVQTAIYAE